MRWLREIGWAWILVVLIAAMTARSIAAHPFRACEGRHCDHGRPVAIHGACICAEVPR